jgi:hypothetical protein
MRTVRHYSIQGLPRAAGQNTVSRRFPRQRLSHARLVTLVEASGATLVGAGIVIEKAFQPGGGLLRSRGIHLESLARIKSMRSDGSIEFC